MEERGGAVGEMVRGGVERIGGGARRVGAGGAGPEGGADGELWWFEVAACGGLEEWWRGGGANWRCDGVWIWRSRWCGEMHRVEEARGGAGDGVWR